MSVSARLQASPYPLRASRRGVALARRLSPSRLPLLRSPPPASAPAAQPDPPFRPTSPPASPSSRWATMACPASTTARVGAGRGPCLWRNEASPGVLVCPASLLPSSPRAARDTRARASELQQAPRPAGAAVASHKVTVHDRQRGVVHEFVVPEDQYILHTAEAQDIRLPFACRHGCCTSCAVRIKSGQIRQPEALGISAELKDKGYALLCVGFPTGDVEVETQDEDEVYWLQFGRYFARGPVERDDYALELAMGDE